MSSPRHPTTAAARLGRYELFGQGKDQDPLGGVPWVARDASLHRRVWVFPTNHAAIAEDDKRALGRSTDISDPTVLSALDAIAVDKRSPEASALATLDLPVPGTYLVVEHVDARPLERWLEQAPLPGPAVRTILRDVATALHEAHQRGIVHGRLTADFVLVDKRGRAHLWLFEPERRLLAPDTVGHATPDTDIIDLVHLGRALVGRLGFAARALVRELVFIFEERSSGELPTLEELLDRLEPRNPARSADRLRVPVNVDGGPSSGSSLLGATPTPTPTVDRTGTRRPDSSGARDVAADKPSAEVEVEAAALANLKAALFAKAGGGKPVSSRPPDARDSLQASGEMVQREATQPVFRGRYRLLDKLGRGGAGTVVLAQDLKFAREVAIKIIAISPDDAEAETELRRLEREARALARIRHSNVVKVFETGTYEDDPAVGTGRNRGAYMVLEYVAGESLYEWSTRPRDWREVVAVYIQVARGLAAAHERGVVHRDFKPANAILGSDGIVRVVDFGLAAGEATGFSQSWATMPGVEETRAVWGDRLTGTGMVVGTPAYMAPERYKGAVADELSDQFSFCVALFESLYGEWPFDGRTSKELRREIMRGRIHWREDVEVPEPLKRILERGLSGAPEQRFPDMKQVCEVLAGDLARDGAVTQPNDARTYALVGAVVAGAAAIIGAAWWLIGS